MSPNRQTAIIAGVLFITATVSAILGVVLIEPILDNPDYLHDVTENENQVLIGVLLELITAGSVAGTAIALFPILGKHNEGLALGYVGGRIREGGVIVIGAIGALLLLTLSQEVVAGAADAPHSETLGTLLVAVRDWTAPLGPNVALSINAVMLSYLLYQSRLVPRFLPVWGLIGAPVVLAAGLLVMFGLTPRF